MSDILDQFERIPGPQKLLILIGLMGGIALAFYFIIWTSQNEEIANAYSDIEAAFERQARLLADAENIERLRAEVEQLCQWQQVFMERLPSERGISQLLRSIQQQSQLTGVEISSSRIGADARGQQYTTVPLTIQMTGTYDEVSEFFYFLGRQPRIVNVRNIRLTAARGRRTASADGTSAGTPLNVTFNLATYYTDPGSVQGVEACN